MVTDDKKSLSTKTQPTELSERLQFESDRFRGMTPADFGRAVVRDALRQAAGGRQAAAKRLEKEGKKVGP